ncbi:ECF transporter S component [Aminivibrio sp.]|jgi:uncharacterized membrane protein|uniref:ECF transporter S component n=1 Tax=Aminivibrio sp. TaxID=1872489 RepID=UPI001A4896DF|nr:ECF transporter S component [Aminivibrio sp.]MBL3540443.1 ECF transporter S component [Aminivibrio sp.]
MNATLAKKVALRGLLIAAVTGATMLSIPVPGFRLYFNFGEGIIYTAALLLGPAWGAAAGGIGASLADLLLGYPLWAPFTLFIKGTEGYVTGKLGIRSPLLGITSGAAVMTAGYSTMAAVLYGRAAAPVELVTDLLQCGMGAALALAALKPLRQALSRSSGGGM